MTETNPKRNQNEAKNEMTNCRPTKMKSKPDRKELIQLNRKYPGKYLYIDKFNQDIKLIHYLDLNRIYSRLGQLNQN